MKNRMGQHNATIKEEDIEWVYDLNIFITNEPSSVIGTIEVKEFELPEAEEYAVLTNIDRERAEKTYPKPRRTN